MNNVHKVVCVCARVCEVPRRPTSAAVSKVSLNETRAMESDPLSCLCLACIVWIFLKTGRGRCYPNSWWDNGPNFPQGLRVRGASTYRMPSTPPAFVCHVWPTDAWNCRLLIRRTGVWKRTSLRFGGAVQTLHCLSTPPSRQDFNTPPNPTRLTWMTVPHSNNALNDHTPSYWNLGPHPTSTKPNLIMNNTKHWRSIGHKPIQHHLMTIKIRRFTANICFHKTRVHGASQLRNEQY